MTDNNKTYPFLDLALANAPYMDELKQAACDVITSGRYLHGEQTNALEAEIAKLCEVKHCIAVSNGLDALRLIIRAYKEMGLLHEGDKVIVPANTYVASVLAISDNGLSPCFCEPSESTMNLDANYIESLLSPSVKAIMPVHLYGTPCWDDKLMKMAQHYQLLVIEDNAQSIGAKSDVAGMWGTYHTGGLGNAGAISFYPTKNLGALGDGGTVVTNDTELANCVRALANYGSDYRYHNIYRGLNCRIDEIQAAFLLTKLRHLDEEISRRQSVASTYNDCISNPHVKTPYIFAKMKQVWHQYVIRVDARDKFRAYLKDNGVNTDIHYATPPHLQPCYKEYKSYKLPRTIAMANEVVSLPVAYPITPDDAASISEIINKFEP
ncbi:MAG: DegT/DnrJ/EryC1/StrS family aminotransferase [Sodaliphilus sp.]|nr:DegT/DnrJ/EryC1/StrS family aminotransferase [Sodaliphilus sp.]